MVTDLFGLVEVTVKYFCQAPAWPLTKLADGLNTHIGCFN